MAPGEVEMTHLEGSEVLDSSGTPVGRISTVYVDPDTQRPQWGLLDTGLGGKHTFVPLAGAKPSASGIAVPYERELIRKAGAIDPETLDELSMEEEAALAKHYGLGYSTTESSTGVVSDAPAGALVEPGSQTSMTRSEEEMKVAVTRRPSELVRLKKTITTEKVSQSVTLQKEELQVERVAISAEKADQIEPGEIAEEEYEVTLMQEEPVVSTKVVPVERVTVRKDSHTEEQTVSADLRREQISVDRDHSTEADTKNG